MLAYTSLDPSAGHRSNVAKSLKLVQVLIEGEEDRALMDHVFGSTMGLAILLARLPERCQTVTSEAFMQFMAYM